MGYQDIADLFGCDRSTVSRWCSGDLPLYLDTAGAVARHLQGVEWSEEVRSIGRGLAQAIAEEAGATLTGPVRLDADALSRTVSQTATAVLERAGVLVRAAVDAEADGVVTPDELRTLIRLMAEHVDCCRGRLAVLEERLRAASSA
ncbi:MAG: hypothetical protein Q8R92_20985 [Deltaproteobacteria bacterium]|nr:hypothetical protein [Deltaproteobacteria bacterium]